MKKITLGLASLVMLMFGAVATAQISTFPYEESFEAGAGGWASDGGANDTWELGAPANTIINSASDGTNAWVTDLDGLYSTNQQSAVVSPVFDFSALTVDPNLTMDIWWESEFSWDGAVLQSTVDGGTTWTNVGAEGDPNNWYNDATISGLPAPQEGWTGRNGSGSNGWVEAEHSLDGLAGQAAVQLRVLFGSDGSVADEGFAFDNVSISNCVTDLQCQDATASLDENGMLEGTFEQLVQNAIVTITPNGTLTPPTVSTDTPVAIGPPGDYQATADVSGVGGAIGSEYVPVVTVDIAHTWDADINISLIAPDGTELALSNGNGGTGDNYTNTVFRDGFPVITTGAPPFTGTFSAEGGSMADAFDGVDVDGTWTLNVEETFGSDGIAINNFEMQFEELGKNVFAPDGCDGALLTFSPNSFDCMTTGDNVVTITAATGETCTATLTVLAGVAFDGPVDIFTGSGTTTECSAIVNYDDVVADIEGCTGMATVTQTAGLASGSEFPVGTTTNTFEAADGNGTILDTYSFNVTITDTSLPVIDCPSDFAVSPDDGSDVYTIPDWSSLASDNCSSGADLVFVQTPAAGETVADGSMTDVTFTATDEAGNVTECTFVLTVDETLSTGDFALDTAITVYPNPVADQFTLRNGSNAQLSSVTISDINGRVIETIDLSEMTTEKQINIANYASGVYFARISTGNATSVKRIVKR